MQYKSKISEESSTKYHSLLSQIKFFLEFDLLVVTSLRKQIVIESRFKVLEMLTNSSIGTLPNSS